jgi:hypothetical protein
MRCLFKTDKYAKMVDEANKISSEDEEFFDEAIDELDLDD